MNQVHPPVLHWLIVKQPRRVLQSRLFFHSYSLHQLGPLLFLHHQLIPLLSVYRRRRLMFLQSAPRRQIRHSGGLRLEGYHLLHDKMSDHTPFSKLSHFWHDYLKILILLHCCPKYVLSELGISLTRCIYSDETRPGRAGTTVIPRKKCHSGET